VEPEPPKPVITLKVDINLSSQRMTVKSGDEVLHSWPISSGRSGYFTPNGTYQPQWRAKMWRSKQYYGSPMPHSVFFHRGYAVHGTYATGMLGRPASHGCVRLAPKHAATFYNLVGKHGMESTKIVVSGKTPSSRVATSRKSEPSRQAYRRRAPSGYANYGGAPFWMGW
jgi:lipoprotein-anchoring transpeptidase ErfK/SrfK